MSPSPLAAAVVIAIALTVTAAFAAAPANYDEAKVPHYTLPDPLTFNDGSKVASAADWPRRRAEILHLFEQNVYGVTPDKPLETHSQIIDVDRHALAGKATRKQITIHLGKNDRFQIHLLMYIPNAAKHPVPAFLALNFRGNHSITDDIAVRVEPDAAKYPRGSAKHRWPIDMILARGYAVVTAWYGDTFPDRADGRKDSVQTLFDKPTAKDPDGWGALATWAWQESRIMDYLQTDDDIDSHRVALLGHSRLGKAALWAGATDKRFALVISNESGCGGAALSRRAVGETVAAINEHFPHWFCTNFKKYDNNEAALPVDQHELLALIAPRPLYVASAEGDRWSDPHGEFLSLVHAGPVYQLLGKKPLPSDKMPEVEHPLVADVAYHIRRGKHDVADYDWHQYLAFADSHMHK